MSYTPGLTRILRETASTAAPPTAEERERAALARSLDSLEEELEQVDLEFFKHDFDPMPAVIGVLGAGGGGSTGDVGHCERAERMRNSAYTLLKEQLSAVDAAVLTIIKGHHADFSKSVGSFSAIFAQFTSTQDAIRELRARIARCKATLTLSDARRKRDHAKSLEQQSEQPGDAARGRGAARVGMRALAAQKAEHAAIVDILERIVALQAAPADVRGLLLHRRFLAASVLLKRALDDAFELCDVGALQELIQTLMDAKAMIMQRAIEELETFLFAPATSASSATGGSSMPSVRGGGTGRMTASQGQGRGGPGAGAGGAAAMTMTLTLGSSMRLQGSVPSTRRRQRAGGVDSGGSLRATVGAARSLSHSLSVHGAAGLSMGGGSGFAAAAAAANSGAAFTAHVRRTLQQATAEAEARCRVEARPNMGTGARGAGVVGSASGSSVGSAALALPQHPKPQLHSCLLLRGLEELSEGSGARDVMLSLRDGAAAALGVALLAAARQYCAESPLAAEVAAPATMAADAAASAAIAAAVGITGWGGRGPHASGQSGGSDGWAIATGAGHEPLALLDFLQTTGGTTLMRTLHNLKFLAAAFEALGESAAEGGDGAQGAAAQSSAEAVAGEAEDRRTSIHFPSKSKVKASGGGGVHSAPFPLQQAWAMAQRSLLSLLEACLAGSNGAVAAGVDAGTPMAIAEEDVIPPSLLGRSRATSEVMSPAGCLTPGSLSTSGLVRFGLGGEGTGHSPSAQMSANGHRGGIGTRGAIRVLQTPIPGGSASESAPTLGPSSATAAVASSLCTPSPYHAIALYRPLVQFADQAVSTLGLPRELGSAAAGSSTGAGNNRASPGSGASAGLRAFMDSFLLRRLIPMLRADSSSALEAVFDDESSWVLGTGRRGSDVSGMVDSSSVIREGSFGPESTGTTNAGLTAAKSGGSMPSNLSAGLGSSAINGSGGVNAGSNVLPCVVAAEAHARALLGHMLALPSHATEVATVMELSMGIVLDRCRVRVEKLTAGLGAAVRLKAGLHQEACAKLRARQAAEQEEAEQAEAAQAQAGAQRWGMRGLGMGGAAAAESALQASEERRERQQQQEEELRADAYFRAANNPARLQTLLRGQPLYERCKAFTEAPLAMHQQQHQLQTKKQPQAAEAQSASGHDDSGKAGRTSATSLHDELFALESAPPLHSTPAAASSCLLLDTRNGGGQGLCELASLSHSLDWLAAQLMRVGGGMGGTVAQAQDGGRSRSNKASTNSSAAGRRQAIFSGVQTVAARLSELADYCLFFLRQVSCCSC
jgi:hypothetical protein